MTRNFNLPACCTPSDINGPVPLICDECGEEFYGEKPREIGDVVMCRECERKENENEH